ncbi:MAG: ATP-binding protein [Candidatus Saccharimonadales bacterium]
MFQSATLKLTGWYLLILMSISFVFSVAIYNIASQEVDNRLHDLQARFERSILPEEPDIRYSDFRHRQNTVATTNLFLSLLYVNIVIVVLGGAGSYLLARRTLQDIEDAHEAQSRFTSDASHELRTPLAIMKSEIEVTLRDPNASKQELREILESNLEEVDKLGRLSKVLLQLSKIDHTDIVMEKLALELVLRDVIKRQNQPASRITLTSTPRTPAARGNQESIEELCMILLDNALKYSPSDSLVSIKLSRRGNRACIEMTNTGKGISAQDLPHIFDRFYRADTSRTSTAQSGHGLGLALAKRIIEIHHGELLATSARNHATTFTILLPIFNKNKA